MKKILLVAILASGLAVQAQKKNPSNVKNKKSTVVENKIVVYQVFTRLFGNKNTTNKPWGTIEEM